MVSLEKDVPLWPCCLYRAYLLLVHGVLPLLSMTSEPDVIDVFLDDKKLSLEAGQGVKEHGIDRSLDPEEMLKRGNALAHP